jgi:hypothetical protein
MKDWKLKQEIFHRLNKNYKDDLSNFEINISENVVDNAVKYFKEKDVGWIYPAKSYMVAICYSKWLKENFGGDFFEYLNDEDLLYGNDPFFKPYLQDKLTYDSILEKINFLSFNENEGIVLDVKSYFIEEFLWS